VVRGVQQAVMAVAINRTFCNGDVIPCSKWVDLLPGLTHPELVAIKRTFWISTIVTANVK